MGFFFIYLYKSMSIFSNNKNKSYFSIL